MSKFIDLPTVLDEENWMYKKHPKDLEPFLGQPYLSYSSKESWENYRGDFIKSKFAKFPRNSSIYAELGNYIEAAWELGRFETKNDMFGGEENLKYIPRPEGAEFQKLVVIPRNGYNIIGFIDMFLETPKGAHVVDLKTGGKGKESKYSAIDYLQVPLYAYGAEMDGHKISDTYVWFVRRVGSHFNPPLKITNEQFKIPIKYNKSIGKSAVSTMDRVAKEIEEVYKIYKKVFE